MFKTISRLSTLRHRVVPYAKEYGVMAAANRALIEVKRIKKINARHEPESEWELLYELNPEVIVVSNDRHSPSHEYRVTNLVTAFWALGKPAVWVNRATFKDLKFLPRNTQLVILWRTAESLDAYPCYQAAKSQVKFIYDTDDLTFDAEVYNSTLVSGLKYIPKSTVKKLTGDVLTSQRNLIASANAFIGPTQQLLESAKELNSQTFLIPNVLTPSDMERARIVRAQPKKHHQDGILTLGYASGTKTHNEDFESISHVLAKFLDKNPTVLLEILGLLDLAPILQKFVTQGRLITKPIVPSSQLLEAISEWDINLAPLVLPNKFNEAKSELKWTHAAILGIPSIVSPSSSFQSVVEHEVDGIIAKDDVEWLNALEFLTIEKNRVKLGNNALKKVEEIRSVDYLAKCLSKALTSMDLVREQKARVEIHSIVWVLPNLPTGSGGHRNIFRLAAAAGKLGYSSKILILSGHSNSHVDDFARQHYGDGPFSVTANVADISQSDLVVATHHSTMPIVLSKARTDSRIGYVVQDFEPWFYAMGQQYLEALGTYQTPNVNMICSGRWMSKKVESITGRKAEFFEFPVDRDIYNDDLSEGKGVLFFAKPDTPRRLFQLGIDALRIVKKIMPDVDISLFGSSEDILRDYAKEFNVLGKKTSLNEVADLYRANRIGLAFSTSNPSLVPIEMMSCGLPVVDVRNEVTETFYPSWVVENILSEVDANSVASKIIKLLVDQNFHETSVKNGKRFVETFPTEEMLIPIVDRWINDAI